MGFGIGSTTVFGDITKDSRIPPVPQSNTTQNINQTLSTNMGDIPLVDYLEIKAQQCGFDNYKEFYNAGYRVEGYEQFSPGNFVRSTTITL